MHLWYSSTSVGHVTLILIRARARDFGLAVGQLRKRSGMLQLVEADDPDDYDISEPLLFHLPNCLWVPGPKHLIDNIIGDVLERLEAFNEFQSSLKACTETWRWCWQGALFIGIGPLESVDMGPGQSSERSSQFKSVLLSCGVDGQSQRVCDSLRHRNL